MPWVAVGCHGRPHCHHRVHTCRVRVAAAALTLHAWFALSCVVLGVGVGGGVRGGGAGISAVEPAQYCRRFVRWIRHEVIDGDDFTRLGLGMEEEDEEGHRDSPGPTSLRTSSDASALSSVGSVGGGRSASRSQQRGRVDMAVMHEEQDTDLESSGSSGDDDGDSGGGGGDGGGGDARSS